MRSMRRSVLARDFETQAILFDDFAREGNVAGDLGDEASQGGGFVVLRKTEGRGIVFGVSECAVVARIVWIYPVAKILGADVAEVVLLR